MLISLYQKENKNDLQNIVFLTHLSVHGATIGEIMHDDMKHGIQGIAL